MANSIQKAKKNATGEKKINNPIEGCGIENSNPYT